MFNKNLTLNYRHVAVASTHFRTTVMRFAKCIERRLRLLRGAIGFGALLRVTRYRMETKINPATRTVVDLRNGLSSIRACSEMASKQGAEHRGTTSFSFRTNPGVAAWADLTGLQNRPRTIATLSLKSPHSSVDVSESFRVQCLIRVDCRVHFAGSHLSSVAYCSVGGTAREAWMIALPI